MSVPSARPANHSQLDPTIVGSKWLFDDVTPRPPPSSFPSCNDQIHPTIEGFIWLLGANGPAGARQRWPRIDREAKRASIGGWVQNFVGRRGASGNSRLV